MGLAAWVEQRRPVGDASGWLPSCPIAGPLKQAGRLPPSFTRPATQPSQPTHLPNTPHPLASDKPKFDSFAAQGQDRRAWDVAVLALAEPSTAAYVALPTRRGWAEGEARWSKWRRTVQGGLTAALGKPSNVALPPGKWGEASQSLAPPILAPPPLPPHPCPPILAPPSLPPHPCPPTLAPPSLPPHPCPLLQRRPRPGQLG